MSGNIHPTAIIHPGASLADTVKVGAYCVVEDDVHIDSETVLESHVTLMCGTRIGNRCHLFPGAVIGGPPQDRKYSGENTLAVLGDDNIVREYVTVHRSSGEGSTTRIGNDNMLMAYAHVGHNCTIGSSNIISSYVGISGHCEIEDNCVLGGMVGVHQFTRIGRLCMVGGMTRVRKDVPPFTLCEGSPSEILDLNVIGLRRAGIPPAVRSSLRQAYKLMYRSGLNLTQAIERIEEDLDKSPELDYLVTFMRGTQVGYSGRANDPRRL